MKIGSVRATRKGRAKGTAPTNEMEKYRGLEMIGKDSYDEKGTLQNKRRNREFSKELVWVQCLQCLSDATVMIVLGRFIKMNHLCMCMKKKHLEN